MNEHECIIGLLHDDYGNNLVTLKDLLEEIKIQASLYQDFCDMYARYSPGRTPKAPFILADYCDKRRSTNLTRFEYCPYCGQKIDWKKIKEENKEV